MGSRIEGVEGEGLIRTDVLQDPVQSRCDGSSLHHLSLYSVKRLKMLLDSFFVFFLTFKVAMAVVQT